MDEFPPGDTGPVADMSSIEQEILRQLAEIQRSVGETTATIAAVREDIKTEANETASHRETINSKINNALQRIAKLEQDVASLALIVEKTVNPLVKHYADAKQRMIGFMSAWGLFITVATGAGGLLWWLVTGGFVIIAQSLGRVTGNNG